MLIYLIDNRFLLFRDLDSYPLGYDDSYAAADDVESWLLFLGLGNQSVGDERIEVELIVEDVGCQTNGGVYRVFEENILVLWCCCLLA